MRALVTGGCGFIGSNVVKRLLGLNWDVVVMDNLSRSKEVRDEMEVAYPLVRYLKCNVSYAPAVEMTVRGGRFDLVVHEAAQTSSIASVGDPVLDFFSNAVGTFNLLEACRKYQPQAVFIYASTNKVYGTCDDLLCDASSQLQRSAATTVSSARYQSLPVSEARPVDPHAPYACSKYAGESYVYDYARIYGMKTVVFRQSCIYGPGQHGSSEQGWIAWFLAAIALGRQITICGDGRQVRDVLFVDDLINAYLTAYSVARTGGMLYNIGGGPENTISIWEEFRPLAEKIVGRKAVEPRYEGWRPGDQKSYVSDVSKINRELGWKPLTGIEEGVRKTWEWVKEHLDRFGE